MLADQAQLAQEGGELARRIVPLDVVRRLEDPRGLLVIVGAEVGEEPGADLPRLADVENAARGGQHAIDTGAVLGERPHPDAQPLEVGGCSERGTARYCSAFLDGRRP